MSKQRKTTLPAERRGTTTIAQHLEDCIAYDNYRARIINGEMEILYQGQWITNAKFKELVKPPHVVNFNHSTENPDRTKTWMHI